MQTTGPAVPPEGGQDLVALYREGADHDVQELQSLVERLGGGDADWAELRPRLREIVHNVKGQGAAFGYELMTRVGESLSKLLHAVEQVDARTAKLMAAHVTTLRTVLDRDITGSGGDLGNHLASKLESLVDKVTGA